MSDRPTPWLLLPVKSLQWGKCRLDAALGDVKRRSLNDFLLRRMLDIAADFPGLQRTAVVSDAADTLSLAEKLGARTIRSKTPELNQALADGRRELHASDAKEILILPVDLPLVRTDDLLEVALLGERHPAVICPDARAAGTNAMYLSTRLPLRFRFGEDSYRRHQAEARRCGVTPFLHFNARIAKDIDLPDDLAILDDVTDYDVSLWR